MIKQSLFIIKHADTDEILYAYMQSMTFLYGPSKDKSACTIVSVCQ